MKKSRSVYRSSKKSVSIFFVCFLISIGAVIIGKLFLDKTNNDITLLLQRQKSSIPSPIPTTSGQTSRLKSNYTVRNLNTNWDILESADLNFSISIPKGSSVDKGGGFDVNNPEGEMVQIGCNIPTNIANAVVVINTGRKLSKSIYEIAENVTKMTGPANFIYTSPEKKTINGVPGYEIYASNNNNQFAYHFFTVTEDRYLDIWYYYPWDGQPRTGKEKTIVEQSISSFRLLK